MVFGWGKKKTEKNPESAMKSIKKNITLENAHKIIQELEEIRSKTLIEKTSHFKNKIPTQFNELKNIAILLEKDSLNVNDIDKHLKVIVERGKKQVISIIKEETDAKISNIKTIDNVLSLNAQIGRSLKHIGDVLGRQSRIIHIFAKKYSGKLKTILADLQNDVNAIQALIDNYEILKDTILKIDDNLDIIKKSKKLLEKQSERIIDFESALKNFEIKIKQITLEINNIKNTDNYIQFLQTQKQLEQLVPQNDDLRRKINDQFTKISRPLGKYEYISSLDKDQKKLLGVLVSDPFTAISSSTKKNIIQIIQSVKKGVLSGAVSVKDTEKSIQVLDEITNLLDSLIRQKESFSAKKSVLQEKLDSFDTGNINSKKSELDKTIQNCNDIKLKIKRFQTEIHETEILISKLITNIEEKLQDISSIKYIIQ